MVLCGKDMQDALNPMQRLMNDLVALADRERQWPFVVQVPRSRAAEFGALTLLQWREFALGLADAEIEQRLKKGVLAIDEMEIAGVQLTVAGRDDDDCAEVRSLDTYD